jgi:TctA family transporter
MAYALWTLLAILLIRTYAFYNRNRYALVLMLCGLAGMVAYQLYVTVRQTFRTLLSC